MEKKSGLPDFYKTGHRGCRGLMPENTIPGFLEALRLGVNTLELDVVISQDGQVVVSHEPYMNHEFCLLPDGGSIGINAEKYLNLYTMTYDEILHYDCGLKPHPRFPKQKKMRAVKPLLTKVIDDVQEYSIIKNLPPVIFDIEIKSEPPEYGISQPEPEEFSEKIIHIIKKKKLEDHSIVRSFDPAPLRYIHRTYPDIPLALIVENNLTAKENLDQLGFIPYMYSPEYILLTESEMLYLKKKGLKVVPWTVNTREEMDKMLALGVDGIITDYPDLF